MQQNSVTSLTGLFIQSPVFADAIHRRFDDLFNGELLELQSARSGEQNELHFVITQAPTLPKQVDRNVIGDRHGIGRFGFYQVAHKTNGLQADLQMRRLRVNLLPDCFQRVGAALQARVID